MDQDSSMSQDMGMDQDRGGARIRIRAWARMGDRPA